MQKRVVCALIARFSVLFVVAAIAGCGVEDTPEVGELEQHSELVNAAPVVDFSFTTKNFQIILTNKTVDTDGTIVQWSWALGDGYTTTEKNPTYTYASPGTYNVRLTAKDDDG